MGRLPEAAPIPRLPPARFRSSLLGRPSGVSPMVDMKVVLKASSEKRNSTQVLPTPESPISSSLNSRSYVFFAMEPPVAKPQGTGSGSRRKRRAGVCVRADDARYDQAGRPGDQAVPGSLWLMCLPEVEPGLRPYFSPSGVSLSQLLSRTAGTKWRPPPLWPTYSFTRLAG